MDLPSIVAAAATVALATITGLYLREIKIARRDDPKLKLSVHDPPEDEWQVDVSGPVNSNIPISDYCRLKAILVNPGLVPIEITSVEETFADETGSRSTSSGAFVLPQYRSPEGYGIYVFGLPWIIRSDNFAIWYRTFKLAADTGKKHVVTLTFHYEVGRKSKSITTHIELNPH